METLVTLENPVSGHIESATCAACPLAVGRIISTFATNQGIDPCIVEVSVRWPTEDQEVA